jgi:glycosyltransferase involved in cell wall biosynthesis
MRLLLLTPQVPYPPRQGTALRNWGLLRGLALHHAVTLLSFAAPDQPLEPPAPLAELVERVVLVPQPTRTLKSRLMNMMASPRPDLILRLESPAFRQELRNLLAGGAWDWVVVEGIELTGYLDLVWALPARPRVVFDDHNCEYLLQQRAFLTDVRRPARWIAAGYSFIQWQRLRRHEATICRRAELVIAVSEVDATALRRIAPGVTPLVIPNGIHVAEYAGFAGRASLQQPAFVFTGTLDFRPNVDGLLWFAQEVWPRIQAALPEAHFYVVGRRPHARLSPLAQQPGIVLTGAVPDTRPYIGAAAVYVVPLLVGGGTRLKLLEAMAMGRAIVSTPLGAEGFPAVEQAVTLAAEPEAFAAACVRLAQEEGTRAAWGARAQAYVQAYDWERLWPGVERRLRYG